MKKFELKSVEIYKCDCKLPHQSQKLEITSGNMVKFAFFCRSCKKKWGKNKFY